MPHNNALLTSGICQWCCKKIKGERSKFEIEIVIIENIEYGLDYIVAAIIVYNVEPIVNQRLNRMHNYSKLNALDLDYYCYYREVNPKLINFL